MTFHVLRDSSINLTIEFSLSLGASDIPKPDKAMSDDLHSHTNYYRQHNSIHWLSLLSFTLACAKIDDRRAYLRPSEEGIAAYRLW